jgi:hypothetical protein
MAKLNELLAVHKALHENLANQNFTMETDFMNKLKVRQFSPTLFFQSSPIITKPSLS